MRISFLYLLLVFLFFIPKLKSQDMGLYTLFELDSICFKLAQQENFLAADKYVQLLFTKAKNTNDTLYWKNALEFLIKKERKFSNNESAENYSYQLLALFEKKGKSEDYDRYVSAIAILGNLYYDLGRINEAKQQYLEGINILEKNADKNCLYGEVLSNLAIINVSEGNLEQAKIYMIESLEITDKHLGQYNETYCVTLTNLAIIYEYLGNIKKAQKIILKALKISRKNVTERYLLHSHVLIEMARFYSKYGEPEKSEPFLVEALDLLKEKVGYRNINTLLSIQGFGGMEYYKKDYLKSLGYAKECFFINSKGSIDTSGWEQILETIPKADILSFDILSRNLGLIEHLFIKLHEETEDKKWLNFLYKTYLIKNSMNNKYRYSLSFEEDKLALARKNALFAPRAIQAALELNCKECLWNAFLLAEENKSMLLAEALKSDQNNIFGNIPINLKTKEKALQGKLIELKRSLVELSTESSIQDSLRNELSQINKNIVQFKGEVKRRYPKYYENNYLLDVLSLEETQALLREKQGLLEYLITPTKTYAFLVTSAGVKVKELNIHKDSLETRVIDFKNILVDVNLISEEELSENIWRYAKAGYWFYEMLVEPILAMDEVGIEQLTIIPDGALGHLPFEAFLTELPNKDELMDYSQLAYLLHSYQLNYSYSATLLEENRKESNRLNQRKMLAYAASYSNVSDYDLTYKIESKHLRKIRSELTVLSETSTEIERLKELFHGVFRVGNQATEYNFKQDISGNYSVLHLAMHGVLNKTKPILSALAFTEVGDSLEDNFLQAYEISQLDVNANLVVLSACETGIGKYEEGEGMMSLARSFMYAGAPSLVVSLWRVNDLSTSVLMPLFYDYLSKGDNKALALQKAKKLYLQKINGVAAHPTFWAAFIQLGDSTPIFIDAKKSYDLKWGIMIVAISCVLIIFTLLRGKIISNGLSR